MNRIAEPIFNWFKAKLAWFHLCWFEHFTLAFMGIRAFRFAGFWWAAGFSIIAMIAETYKAFIFDRAHGVESWKETWGDWIFTLIGCLMGIWL